MVTSHESECTCTDCGVKITGVPIVPAAPEGPTQAQMEKLKPTVYLCVECARMHEVQSYLNLTEDLRRVILLRSHLRPNSAATEYANDCGFS
jgi:DNA-directed RNA polymerase subunit RPC12/RpoP